MKLTRKPIHIGDGVYIWTDGYHVWLGTNDGYSMTNKIALDPQVQATLVNILTQGDDNGNGQ